MTEPAAPAKPATAPPAAAAPAAPAPAPAAQPTAGGLTAAEQVQLGNLLAKQTTAGVTAERFKVEPPHSSFSYGGATVGTEFTTVPGGLVAAFATAAAEAGVTLTQES